MSGKRLDFSHKIKHLSFGDDQQMKNIEKKFGDQFKFDLDGSEIDQTKFLYQGQLMSNYYLDVNEIEYLDETQKRMKYYQGYKIRTQRSILATMGLPVIFFRYELSPILLRYTVTYGNWVEFVTNICAIVGGIFTVASIVEAFIRNSYSFVAGSKKVR